MSEEELDDDILSGFVEESNAILEELHEIVEKLEDYEEGDEFPRQNLEDFSQRIDRIMGAAKTLLMMAPDHAGLDRIGKISNLCKSLGYAAAQNENPKTIPIFAAFWADSLEVVEDLTGAIRDKAKTEKIASDFSQTIQGRLEWLSTILKPVNAYGISEQIQSQDDIDAMLNDLAK